MSGIFKEFDEERSRLRDLLRDEYNRGHRLDAPWDCVESECPHFKHPMSKSCGCYQDATKAHIVKVLFALASAGADFVERKRL